MMELRFSFWVLYLGAAVFLTAGVGEASSHSIWWYMDLNLDTLANASLEFVKPFAVEPQTLLAKELAQAGKDAAAAPRNCQSLLREEKTVWGIGRKEWRTLPGTWEELCKECILLAALRDARPARVSYLDSISWDDKTAMLLPAGLSWVNSNDEAREARKADQRHETLWQFHPKSQWDIQLVEDTLLAEQNSGNPPYDAYYGIAASGDFNGDGIEDWIVEVTGSVRDTQDGHVQLFLVTRRSSSGRVQILKRLL